MLSIVFFIGSVFISSVLYPDYLIFLILCLSLRIFNEKKSKFWVVECNKKLVAFIQLTNLKSYFYIAQLFVAPDWRRKGLGSSIIKHLIQKVTKPVYVHCSPELVSYYIRLGFVQSNYENRNLLNLLVYNNSVSTFNLSLPKDFTLRKAILQDKLKLLKLEIQEIDFNVLCWNLLERLSWLIMVFYLFDVFAGFASYLTQLAFFGGILLINQIPNLYLKIYLIIKSIFKFNQYISGLWIIEDQGKIVASAKLKQSNPQIYLKDLYVARAWRRKGLGSALTKRIIQEFRQPIYLKCSSQLVNFYTRLGFIQSGSPSLWNGIRTMVYPKK